VADGFGGTRPIASIRRPAAMTDTTQALPNIRSLPMRNGDLIIHEFGRGQPIGYLHGLLGNPPGFSFPALLAEVTGRRVIAPSLPGFSGSALCEEARGLFDWVSIASEVLDAAGLAGAPMVASSISAMLALEVASIRPEAFSALIAIAPFGLWDADDPVTDPFGTTFKLQREQLTNDIAATSVFFDDPEGLDDAAVVDRHVHRYSARAAGASLVWPIPEFGLGRRLHRLRAPTTLVWGSDDRIVPVSYATRFEAAIPSHRTTTVIEEAGHLTEWERPDRVAEIVNSILASPPQSEKGI
jgi:pimeloyl-ACP methyl ester carboxylesterase